jgi:hypothetical protein
MHPRIVLVGPQREALPVIGAEVEDKLSSPDVQPR